MKISLEKRNNNSVDRTVRAFENALIRLLQQYSLEKISIAMLCNESTYPRSTFYNYFEDIFDLIDYIVEKAFHEIGSDDFKKIPPEIRSLTLFENTYDILSQHQITIEKITNKNVHDGLFMERVRNSMKEKIAFIISNSECIAKFPVENKIMQIHYSNTIEMIIEQCFLGTDAISKEVAIKTMDFLLGTLERKVKQDEYKN